MVRHGRAGHTVVGSRDPLAHFASRLTVLVPDGESNFALSVVRCLGRDPDVRVIVASTKPAPPSRFSRYARGFLRIGPAQSDEDYVAAIGEAARRVQADVVLPVDVRAIRAFAGSGQEGVPCSLPPQPTVELFDVVGHKGHLASWAALTGIPVPKTVYPADAETIDRDLTDADFPVLVKPVQRGYGIGIRTFGEPEGLRRFLQQRRDSGDTEEVIVQSRIEGYDIDCSVLCRDGEILAYTIQQAVIAGYQPFSAPAGVRFLHHEPTLDAVRRLVASLGWSGIAHIDLRVDARDGVVKLIEVNPRYWGSLLGSLRAGVNFPALACRIAAQRGLPPFSLKDCRFVAGRATVGALWRRVPADRQAPRIGFRETAWPFIIADPGPLLGPALYRATGAGRRQAVVAV